MKSFCITIMLALGAVTIFRGFQSTEFVPFRVDGRTLSHKLQSSSERWSLSANDGRKAVLLEKFDFGGQELFAVLENSGFRVYSTDRFFRQAWTSAERIPSTERDQTEDIVVTPKLGFVKFDPSVPLSNSIDVRLQNTSTQSVVLESVVPSCSCVTVTRFDHPPLMMPGDILTFQAQFELDSNNEHYSQEIALYSRPLDAEKSRRISVPLLCWQPIKAFAVPSRIVLEQRGKSGNPTAILRIQDTALEQAVIKRVFATRLPITAKINRVDGSQGDSFHVISLELEGRNLLQESVDDVQGNRMSSCVVQ